MPKYLYVIIPSELKSTIAPSMAVVTIPDAVCDRQLFEDADSVLNSMGEFEPQEWNLPELLLENGW